MRPVTLNTAPVVRSFNHPLRGTVASLLLFSVSDKPSDQEPKAEKEERHDFIPTGPFHLSSNGNLIAE
jgi:hypothetical protein